MNKEKQIEEMARVICENTAISCYETAVEIAEEIVKKGYHKQEWISIKDRLPEENTNVLAYSEKYKEIDVYFFAQIDEWWDNNGWTSAKGFGITHWMPLPEEPIESEDTE